MPKWEVILARALRGEADFADYLIGVVNRTEGCVDTVSLDRGLDGVDGFSVLGA